MVPQEAKDTASFLGKMERDPVNLYRYQVDLASGDYAELSVGVRLGYCYLLAATSTREKAEEVKGELKQIADSFKLLSR